MKKLLSNIFMVSLGVCLSASAMAQTAGNLTFSYTPTSHSGYQGTKNVLAVWIQTSTGTFVKTKLRYAGGNTSDHLPTWAVNAGGSSSNCLSSACNTVSATTGATLGNFTTKNITWDGTDVNGNVVADGTYKVTIQSTWNHGSAGTSTRSFTFTKGAVADAQTPADDANFTTISLNWTPTGSGAGIAENVELTNVKVYPSPSTSGIFTVDYQLAKTIAVYNIQGVLVKEQALEAEMGTTTLDLSMFTNGTYMVCVSDGTLLSKHMVVVSK